MPIKFACPQCNNVLQVSSQMAGKTGKCKCGAQVKVPSPKPAQQAAAVAAAPTAAPPPSSNMFDELTDGDFGREDPHTQLYTGKRTNNDAQSLGRFTQELEEEKAKEVGQARGLMIVAAVLNFIFAAIAVAGGVLLLIGSAILAQAEGVTEALPILAVGIAVAATWTFGMALLLLVSGIGGLMRTSWGWFLMAIVYTNAVLDRVIGLGMSFTGEFNGPRFIGQLIGCLFMVSLLAFIYKETTRQMCHITSKVPVIIAAVLGVALAGATWGTIFAIGVEADRQIQAAEAAEAGEAGEPGGY